MHFVDAPFLRDLSFCLRFYTRLPIPALGGETDPHGTENGFERLTRAVRVLPLAGVLIGGFGAAVLLLTSWIGFGPWLAGPLSILALILATGGLHEDGLADCADGFAGGFSVARKLEIMRDSRLGTYGVLALILALWLRIAGLATIGEGSLVLAAFVLVAAAALSRTMALLPLSILPPARADGAGFNAGRPSPVIVIQAFGLAAAVGLLPLAAGASLLRVLFALAIALAAAYGLTRLAYTQIRGHTGDVAGAVQQIVEIVYLLCFAAG